MRVTKNINKYTGFETTFVFNLPEINKIKPKIINTIYQTDNGNYICLKTIMTAIRNITDKDTDEERFFTEKSIFSDFGKLTKPETFKQHFDQQWIDTINLLIKVDDGYGKHMDDKDKYTRYMFNNINWNISVNEI